MLDYAAIHSALRTVHITLGFVGLALFWLIVSLPKGTLLHRRCGGVFVVVAYTVGGTAIVSSVWALADLRSFAPGVVEQPVQFGRDVPELIRFLFSILLFLSVATVAGPVLGVRLVRLRDRHEALRRTSVPFWFAATALTAVSLSIYGGWRLASYPAVPPTGALPRLAWLVPFLLGLFGLAGATRGFRYVFGPAPGPREWMYRHVDQMLGTGVAFHTAFAVLGASRLFGLQFSGIWALAPWVLPPAIGVSLILWYERQLRKRHGDDC